MNKGLTLIETLLYLALLSVFVITAIPLLMDLNMWQAKQNNVADANSEALFIEAKVRNILEQAKSIDVPEVGQSSSELVVTLENGDKLKVFGEKGNAVIQGGGGELIPLNSDKVIVGSFSFNRPLSTRFSYIEFALGVNDFIFGTTSIPIQ